jgi:hypothetical protein
MSTARWRKSSYSADDANCVEIAYWRKSSYSSDVANCVELTFPGPTAAVRDSKNPRAGHLTLPLPTYLALLTFTKR